MNCVVLETTVPNFKIMNQNVPTFTTREETCLPFHKQIYCSMTGYTLHSSGHGILKTWWPK